MGLETAAILGLTGVASAGLGLASADAAASGAIATNKQQIDANKELQEDAQQYNTEMYERQLSDSRENYQTQLRDSRQNYQMQRQDQENFYNRYLSATGLSSQLQKAGINPGSYFGAGKGISSPAAMPAVNQAAMSTPSAPTSPLASVGSLQNPKAAYSVVLPQIASSIKDVASAAQSSETAKRTQTLLEHELHKMIAEIGGQEALNTQIQLENEITKAFGKKKVAAEIKELTQSAFLKAIMGKTELAKKALLEIQEKIGNEDLTIRSQQALNIAVLLKKQINFVDEQIKTEQAKQYELGASATEHLSGAALKKMQSEGQKISNDINGLEQKIKTDPSFVAESLNAAISKARAIALRAGNDETVAKLDKLVLDNRLGFYEDATPTEVQLRSALKELGVMLGDLLPFLKATSSVTGTLP